MPLENVFCGVDIGNALSGERLLLRLFPGWLVDGGFLLSVSAQRWGPIHRFPVFVHLCFAIVHLLTLVLNQEVPWLGSGCASGCRCVAQVEVGLVSLLLRLQVCTTTAHLTFVVHALPQPTRLQLTISAHSQQELHSEQGGS